MATDTHADRSLVPGIERPAAVATTRGPVSVGNVVSKAAFIALLLFFTVLFIYPFIWLVSASLKPGAEVLNGELIPDPIMWENYSRLFELTQMGKWSVNSVYVSLLAAITVTFSSAPVAFAFAYFQTGRASCSQ